MKMAKLPKRRFAEEIKKTLKEEIEIKDNDIKELLEELKPILLKAVNKISFSRLHAIVNEHFKKEYGRGISPQRLKKIYTDWINTLPETEREVLKEILPKRRKKRGGEQKGEQDKKTIIGFDNAF
jgi:hypothetical protein